jgi:hypothetical protein
MSKRSSESAPAPVTKGRATPASIVLAAAGALLAIVALASGLSLGSRQACIDYYQFWVVGRAASRHQTSDPYTSDERARLGEAAYREIFTLPAGPDAKPPFARIAAATQRRVLETYSTPWMYTLFGIASSSDYDADQDRFEALSTIAYALAIAVMCRLLGFSWLESGACVALCILWFKPFEDEVIAGNVNRIQVASIGLFAWVQSRERWRSRHVLAGVVLGLAIAFKPNLALIAVALAIGWAITRELRKLAHAATGWTIGVAIAIAWSSAYFRSARVWSAWLRTIPELLSQGRLAGGGNYALARLVADQTGVWLPRALPFVFLALVALAVATGRTRRADAAHDVRSELSFDFTLAGLGATISVLATELVWLHYSLLCVPLALCMLRPPGASSARHARWPARVAAIVALLLIGLDLLMLVVTIPRPSAASPYVNCGALLLVALAAIELARPCATAGANG